MFCPYPLLGFCEVSSTFKFKVHVLPPIEITKLAKPNELGVPETK